MSDKVVLTKDEFVNIVAEHSDVPSDISDIMKYVESVFVLQTDEDRPAYVFEVDMERMGVDYLATLNEGLKYMKVAAILLPKKSLSYIGEVTPKSMGLKAKVGAIRRRIREMCGILADYQEDDDER